MNWLNTGTGLQWTKASQSFIVISSLIVSFCLILTGCSSDNFALPLRDLSLPDVNPQPRDKVKRGREFFMQLTSWPSNFNMNQIDGELEDLYYIYEAVTFDAFRSHDDGTLYYDKDYFTDIRQYWDHGKEKIMYTINPRAHWSDGTPITWQDFATFAAVQSGKDPRYELTGSNGYVDIESVKEGVNDRQFIVTMREPYGEWQGLFEYMLEAKDIDTPDKFNSAYLTKFPHTAGPYKIASIDEVLQEVRVVRDPTWWGTPPKLDKIVFKEVPNTVGIGPYLTGEMSDMEIESDLSSVKQGSARPGTDIRRAYSSQWMHLDFNNALGRITHDKRIRHAIAHAIDRPFLESAYAGFLVGKHPQVLNNHILLRGLPGYQDNDQGYDYNPSLAREELDAAGWKLESNGLRYKDGQQLLLHFVESNADELARRAMDQIMQKELEAVGIRLLINVVPNKDFFPTYVLRGDYDLVAFKWVNDITPISSGRSIFEQDPHCLKGEPTYDLKNCAIQQNYGLTGSPEINRVYEELVQATDTATRYRLVNQVDKLLWDDMGMLPIFQMPIAYAVKSSLANWGAEVSPTIHWEDVGYTS